MTPRTIRVRKPADPFASEIAARLRAKRDGVPYRPTPKRSLTAKSDGPAPIMIVAERRGWLAAEQGGRF